MTLSRRASAGVQHQKLSSVAAFNAPAEYEFTPGQRVHTLDGLFGVVQAVYEPTGRANESYHVVLDHGLGEGEYTPTQITAAHEVEGSVMSLGTAVESYPELGTVIADHPDPARLTVWASKTAALLPQDHGEHGPFNLHGQCKKCGYTPPTEGDEECDHPYCQENNFPEGWHSKSEHIDPAHLDPHSDAHRDAERAVNEAFGGEDHGWLLDQQHIGPTKWSSKTAASDPDAPRGENGTCAQCGGHIHRTEDTDGEWAHDDADDDDHHPIHRTGAYYTGDELREEGRRYIAEHSSDLDEHGHITHDGHSPACGGHDDYSMLPADSEANSEENKAQHTSLLVQAATDPDLRFHITAAWRDVQAKAKRIRSTGGVHIVTASGGTIIGEVQGEHGVYEAGLQRLPGKSAGVQAYSCGCKWSGYHANSPKGTSRFAGRMCSHALALHYEAQSRGMFGRDVYADDTQPQWVPARVRVKYDPDSGDYAYARTGAARTVPIGSPLQSLAHDSWLAGESPADLVLAYRSAGIPPQVIKTAVDTAWGIDSMVPDGMGATRPARIDDNPASSGPLTAADPKGWDHPEQSGAPKNSFEATAAWNPLATTPNVPQAGPAVGEADNDQQSGEHNGPNPLTKMLPNPSGGAAEEGAVSGEAAAGGEAAAAGGGEAAAGMAARLLPLLLMAKRNIALLADEPEPALPSTTGEDADQVDHTDPDGEILSAQAMTRTAMKNFTDAERAEIINEGRHARAANRDRMDVSGTHYEHQTDDDDDEFGFLG